VVVVVAVMLVLFVVDSNNECGVDSKGICNFMKIYLLVQKLMKVKCLSVQMNVIVL